MIKYLLIITGFVVSTGAFGQNNLTEEEVSTYTTMLNKAEGTYQIQMIDTRNSPTFPISLIQEIENRRLEDEVVYYNYKPNIRIKILPKNIINQPNFILVDRIKFITSNDL